MLLDGATVESNFQRFVNRIIENETVYYLSNENGVAESVSNNDDETDVLMFWSDRAYAARANHIFEEDFNAAGLIAGSIPIKGTSNFSRKISIAFVVAVLQATTIILLPIFNNNSVFLILNEIISSTVL